jgi:hypothetical protein
MPPTNSETILICPLCNEKGFLRKKHSKFHLPQKTKIDNFYDFLDFLSKYLFKNVSSVLSIDHTGEFDNLPLKEYNKIFVFYKMPIYKIKEFEIDAIKSIIKNYPADKFYLSFSNDLIRSMHLKDIVYCNVCLEKNPQKKVIFLSRKKLTLIFYSILVMALKKSCEIHKYGIEESFEKEMVDGMMSIFYPLTLIYDKRKKWNVAYTKYSPNSPQKIDLQYRMPTKSNEWKKCKNCNLYYLSDSKLFCDKCHKRIYSVRPSRKYLKNKSSEIDKVQIKNRQYSLYFINFMFKIKEHWFYDKEFKHDFLDFFKYISKDTLEKLEMHGNTSYTIRHYDKEKKSKDKDCYISKRSDFMRISIKLNEYNTLIKRLVKAELYDIGKNIRQLRSKLIAILRKLNFPERYILSKINHDYHVFGENYYKERSKVMVVESFNFATNIAQKSLLCLSDPTKIKREIESIPKKCIDMIIVKKLIPRHEIDQYNSIVNQHNKTNQEIPKEILYKNFFPIVGLIDSWIKFALSPNKLNSL